MKPFSLKLILGTAFSILVLTVGGLIGWTAQLKTGQILHESSEKLTHSISRRLISEITYRQIHARTILRLLVRSPDLKSDRLEQRLAGLELFREALLQMKAVVAVYIGYENGDYFLLRKLQEADDRKTFEAPEETAYVVQSIDRAMGESLYIYYDVNLREIDRRSMPKALAFDPRTRPWYIKAQASRDAVETAPYRFYTSGRMGYSLALKFSEAQTTIGVDLRLDDFTSMMNKLRPTPGSRLALFDQNKVLLVSDDPHVTYKRDTIPDLFIPLNTRMTMTEKYKTLRLNHQGSFWQGSLSRVAGDKTRGIYLGLMVPENEIMGEARILLHNQAMLVLGLLAFGLVLGLWFAHRLSRALIRLAGTADAVRQFDFNSDGHVRSLIREVDTLARGMEQMQQTISRFLEITAQVAGEENLEQMLPFLLQNTMETAAAEAGLFYLIHSEKGELHPVVAFSETGQVDIKTLPNLPLETRELGLSKALKNGRPAISQLKNTLLFDETGLTFSIENLFTLAVPLVNRQGHRLGVLLLVCDDAFDRARSRFIEYLSGYASVSLETRELIQAQKALFDAFVRLIAHAIDTKSPYTGAHCVRVPELTRMLAETACAQTEGPFADFHLDEKEWEAVNMAAWLHDCGKVTTPEFVVDKSTRLETRFDRIHEIRTRFEVLKREKEVECWKSITRGSDARKALSDLEKEWQALDDDFQFVAGCNSGDTFMSDEKLQRLRSIARREWTRTLSDRAGIGPREMARKALQPEPSLPVRDAILADRPDHRIDHPQKVAYPPELGITLHPCEWLFDMGEIKNLSIPRGTLTDEERFKINEHAIQALIMLKQLPFPFHLQNVPEMAAGHHERLDGKGYPRGLKGRQINLVARMLTIADIFEALTASDRPYKTAQSPEAAFEIMRNMATEGHIDPDLLDLFEQSGIADRYMKPC